MIETTLIATTILISGFFSGSEIAFVSANKLKLEIESRKKSATGKALAFFTKNPSTFLTTTLVGNNIINVIYATLMALFLLQPVQYWYLEFMGTEPSVFMILLIQTIIASVLIMIFGEILPKAIYRIQADTMVKFVAIPLRALNFLLKPLIVVANSASDVIVKFLNTGTERSDKIFRRQDVEMIFKELSDSGGSDHFDKDDSEILQNVLDLSSKRVKDTMVPRTEIVAVERSESLENVQKTFIASGYSKLPVYQDTIDDVIGVVFAYDLFNNPESVADIIRPVKLIPSSKKSKDLLTDFRQSNSSVAIVIDEYGGTAGMVTIEDLIEEVVGDIQDEYDTEDEVVKKIAPNTFILSGNVELDELEEKFPEIELQKEG